MIVVEDDLEISPDFFQNFTIFYGIIFKPLPLLPQGWKFGTKIFPEKNPNKDPRLWTDDYIKLVAMNFRLALYYVNYSQCFNDDDYQFWKEDY